MLEAAISYESFKKFSERDLTHVCLEEENKYSQGKTNNLYPCDLENKILLRDYFAQFFPTCWTI